MQLYQKKRSPNPILEWVSTQMIGEQLERNKVSAVPWELAREL